MWTIVIILENGKTKVLETIIDDAEAVIRYKTLVKIDTLQEGLATHQYI